jgi:hypothetical protein
MRIEDIQDDGTMTRRDKEVVVRMLDFFGRQSGHAVNRMGRAFDLAAAEVLDGVHDELDDPQAIMIVACEFADISHAPFFGGVFHTLEGNRNV